MKSERQRTILNLISSETIKTQKRLLNELKKLGFETTQATISRDLEELNIHKNRKTGSYGKTSLTPSEDELIRLERSITSFVRQIDESGNLVIVKTTPGGAQGVASALDSVGWEDVMGTVAGDDTILIVARNQRTGEKIVKRLKKFME